MYSILSYHQKKYGTKMLRGEHDTGSPYTLQATFTNLQIKSE